jgi:hypothetical protein
MILCTESSGEYRGTAVEYAVAGIVFVLLEGLLLL